MPDRSCAACGEPLEDNVTARRVLCQRAACRRQRGRERTRKYRAGGRLVQFPASAEAGNLPDAVRAALVEGGQAESWEGRAALLLAERIDATGPETGSGFAALVAKLESSMVLALRPRPGQSFVDELRQRRQRSDRGRSGSSRRGRS